MIEVKLPPCGLYRTRRPLGEIPAGKLVYFHNHGDPGAGVYLPSSWQANRARFQEHGLTLPAPTDAAALEPLAAEGFYRVAEESHCCEKRCRLFEKEALVQLGYDGDANAILFVPELVDGALVVPEVGSRIDAERIGRLKPLKIAVSSR